MKNLLFAISLLLAVALAVALGSNGISARPSFFTDNCSACHNNDSETCNGCHHHGPQNLSAVTDKTEYAQGEKVVVTLDGGNRDGWIRAILYDHNGVELDRATGPTSTGDDGLPDPVKFPVALTGTAPIGSGEYTWEAAWWGSPFDEGNEQAYPHGPEVRTQINLVVTTQVPTEVTTWGKIKALWGNTINWD